MIVARRVNLLVILFVSSGFFLIGHQDEGGHRLHGQWWVSHWPKPGRVPEAGSGVYFEDAPFRDNKRVMGPEDPPSFISWVEVRPSFVPVHGREFEVDGQILLSKAKKSQIVFQQESYDDDQLYHLYRRYGKRVMVLFDEYEPDFQSVIDLTEVNGHVRANRAGHARALGGLNRSNALGIVVDKTGRTKFDKHKGMFYESLRIFEQLLAGEEPRIFLIPALADKSHGLANASVSFRTRRRTKVRNIIARLLAGHGIAHTHWLEPKQQLV